MESLTVVLRVSKEGVEPTFHVVEQGGKKVAHAV
jgi:hypothetical protein